MRAVDLASQERPEVELSLSGQTWRIRRVVMATYQLYQELASGGVEAQSKIAQLQERVTSGEAGDQDVLDMQDEMIRESERRQELTYQCIQTILEANGYEFDRKWWAANSDRHEQHGFIAAAMNKDMQGVGRSKKKEADDSAGDE